MIGAHVSLVKKGRNYLGLCPFHKEKTPSFNVNREKGFYKCFGCGRSGDTIKFMQEYLHLDFLEAVVQLASRLNIHIPDEQNDDPNGEHARRDAALQALKAAVQYFQTVLDSSDGAPARNFFAARGFSTETIKEFQLGAAPATWDSLYQHLTANGFTLDQLNDAGLIVQRDDGSVYDRFRGRAMFPLHDHQGRTVGFSARQLVADPNSPKFVNSPQSVVFDKSRVLYGLDLARREIADVRMALLVEGQADVVSMHQAGFKNTVATSGTSLTVEHLGLLKRYADTVTLVYDADEAGQKAMTRAIELGVSTGLNIRCAVLPAGEDPDSVIRSKGAQAIATALDNATSWLEFQVDRYRKSGALEQPSGQSAAVRTMLGWIKSVPDVIQQPFLVRELSQLFDIDEELLLRQLSTTNKAQTPSHSEPSTRTETAQPQQQPPSAGTATRHLPRIHPAEREILRVALTVENGLTDIQYVFRLDASQFITDIARTIFNAIIVGAEEHPDLLHFLQNDAGLDIPAQAIVADILTSAVSPSTQWHRFEVDLPAFETHRLISNAVDQLKRFKLDAEIHGIKKQLSSTPAFDDQRKLLHRLDAILQERSALLQRIEHHSQQHSWPDVDSV